MTRVPPALRWLLPTVVSVMVVVGCSGSQAPSGLQGAPMVVADGEGACGLLAGRELELVLDAPVETGGGRIGSGERADRPETATAQGPADQAAGLAGSRRGEPRLLPGMDMCRAASREGHVIWGAVAADDSDEPLEELFAAYRQWHGDDLDGLRVDGHEAVWDTELRTLIVLGDEHAVGVQLTIPDPPLDRDEQEDDQDPEENQDDDEDDAGEPIRLERHLDGDEDAYLRTQAVELASRALRRV